MPLKVTDLGLKRPPKLPASMPVFELAAPALQERRAAIGRLGEHLKLGDLRSVTLDHGVVLASKRGDITFFHASGAVLARDATVASSAKNELRKWEGLQDSKQGGFRMSLSPDAAKRLIGQAQELLQPIGLMGREVASADVALEQVSQLDGKGREIAHGAGAATVRFGYAVEGVPVAGAGAKTLAFAEPGDGSVRFSGAFHAWRTIGKATTIKLPSLEEALGVGVLTDPELDLYHAAGHKVQVTKLSLTYLALPAFMRQSHLFPAFQIEGTVSKGKRGSGFNFARYHHAVPPKTYAAADLTGPYLTVNPDGITPLRTEAPRK